MQLLYDQLGEHVLEGWAGAIAGNTLQHLINTTAAGGTLVVPAGAYDPVYVDKQITIQAEEANACTINADCYEPCVEMRSGSEDAVWDGFNFILGKNELGNGGGIAVTASGKAGVVSNCVFYMCEALNGGAAANLKIAALCTFTNCFANADGGATWQCGLVDRSFYWKNLAEANGGASYADTMVRGSFMRYNAAQKGGTGYNSAFYNCTIADSKASENRTVYHSIMRGCALYNSELPTDDYSFNQMKATAQLKSDRFYDIPKGDFHLRVKTVVNNKRVKVDQSDLCVNTVHYPTTKTAHDENWLDLDGIPFVTVAVDSGEFIHYGGCYAYSPFKGNGLVVNGTDEWYDNSNAKTSLREAVEEAIENPFYNTNEVSVITFDPAVFEAGGRYEIDFDEAQIDLAAFTNRTLVVRGPADAVVELNGRGEYRAFRVRAGNSLEVENLVFRNCLGSTYGPNPAPGANGGAILNYGNLSVSNCVFVGNSAGNTVEAPVGNGGAVSTEPGATTTVWRTSFDGNSAAKGGALYTSAGGYTRVLFSTFGRNAARGTAANGLAGGAIASASPDVWLVNCTVVGNSVEKQRNAGGGIYGKSGMVLLDSVVIGNTSGGVTNDIAIADNAATNLFYYTAYGVRSEATSNVAYDDLQTVQADNIGDVIADTNATEDVALLPHIVYPISTENGAEASLSYVNLSSGAVGYYDETTRRAQAIVGKSSALRNVAAVTNDQVEIVFSGGVFGATAMTSNPVVPSSDDDDDDDDDDGDGGDDGGGNDDQVDAQMTIVDAFGKTNRYETADAAYAAFRPGDTLFVSETNETVYADLLDDLYDSALLKSMGRFTDTNALFDLTYDESIGLLSVSLNDEATPLAGQPDLTLEDGWVSVMPTNIFAGLWYTLGGTPNLTGPYMATNAWKEAFAPDAKHGAVWLESPLTAPVYGDQGFYRVFVAPYAPSK